MLMKIRDGATGITAYVIVILLTIPFAFWGIQEYFGGPADQKVAEVNGQEIVKRLFDSELQNQKRYLKSVLGDSYDEVYQDEAQLKESVLDSIIQNTLLNEEIKNSGYTISDTKLFERIRAVPQFQKDGIFDAATYESLLSAQRRSAAEFESQLRQEESVNQYQGSVAFSSFIPKASKQEFASLKQQKRNFDYFLIEPDISVIEVSDEEIRAHYESNKESFRLREKVKLEFLEIAQNDLAEKLTFSEQEIREYYDSEPDRYRTQELRKARHILLKLAEDASAENVESALNKMQKAAARIKEGEAFEKLAEELSEDDVSAKNGGNLGFLSRTDIDNPNFVEKLFAMQLGEVSAPIRTKLGVQLVRLDEITASEAKPFEDVQSQIENELRAEAAEQEFVAQAEQLSNLTYENEDTLEVAAEAMGIEIQTTDWVSQATLEGIASYPSVVSSAFSEEVLVKGINSDLLELEEGRVAVVRVLEHQESEVQPLADVQDSIKLTLKHTKAIQELLSKGEQIVTNIREGSVQIGDAAKQFDSTLMSPGSLLRDDESSSKDVLDYVFSMPSPKSDEAIIDGFNTRTGKYAVVQLNSVLRVNESEVDLETAEWITVQGQYGRREASAMLKALRETGDVKVYSENL